jgi:hypothetical protein
MKLADVAPPPKNKNPDVCIYRIECAEKNISGINVLCVAARRLRGGNITIYSVGSDRSTKGIRKKSFVTESTKPTGALIKIYRRAPYWNWCPI